MIQGLTWMYAGHM